MTGLAVHVQDLLGGLDSLVLGWLRPPVGGKGLETGLGEAHVRSKALYYL